MCAPSPLLHQHTWFIHSSPHSLIHSSDWWSAQALQGWAGEGVSSDLHRHGPWPNRASVPAGEAASMKWGERVMGKSWVPSSLVSGAQPSLG